MCKKAYLKKTCIIHTINLGKAYIMSVYKTNLQKQLFADVFQNRCSNELRNIHRKTPVTATLLKRDCNTGVFL